MTERENQVLRLVAGWFNNKGNRGPSFSERRDRAQLCGCPNGQIRTEGSDSAGGLLLQTPVIMGLQLRCEKEKTMSEIWDAYDKDRNLLWEIHQARLLFHG